MKLLAESSLLEHEWAALKDALMRDIEREMTMAQADTDFSHSHLYNARMSQRILQVISGEEKTRLTVKNNLEWRFPFS